MDKTEIFVPGRTELGGNHTDHQGGCVLGAGVSFGMTALAAPNKTDTVTVRSAGFGEFSVDIGDTEPRPEEAGTPAALLRGVCAGFIESGNIFGGFDADVESEIPPGSGLSSSAAFEVLLGSIINRLFFGGSVPPEFIAVNGKKAENDYFKKPCGLMDQLICALGGIVFADFADPENPQYRRVNYDFAKSSYALAIIECGAGHADLTEDYVAITSEMGQIANYFGKEVLREVESSEFMEELPNIRKTASDRACLRAMHFFAENNRAKEEFEKLKKGDVNGFLDIVNESGKSSAELLQNLYSCKKPTEQAIPLALAVSRSILGDKGAERVHGGGFAGTIQSFVPQELAEEYKTAMDKLFGEGSCRLMKIRPAGGISFTEYCKNN